MGKAQLWRAECVLLLLLLLSCTPVSQSASHLIQSPLLLLLVCFVLPVTPCLIRWMVCTHTHTHRHISAAFGNSILTDHNWRCHNCRVPDVKGNCCDHMTDYMPATNLFTGQHFWSLAGDARTGKLLLSAGAAPTGVFSVCQTPFQSDADCNFV